MNISSFIKNIEQQDRKIRIIKSDGSYELVEILKQYVFKKLNKAPKIYRQTIMPNISSKGSIFINTNSNEVYLSNGYEWNLVKANIQTNNVLKIPYYDNSKIYNKYDVCSYKYKKYFCNTDNTIGYTPTEFSIIYDENTKEEIEIGFQILKDIVKYDDGFIYTDQENAVYDDNGLITTNYNSSLNVAKYNDEFIRKVDSKILVGGVEVDIQQDIVDSATYITSNKEYLFILTDRVVKIDLNNNLYTYSQTYSNVAKIIANNLSVCIIFDSGLVKFIKVDDLSEMPNSFTLVDNLSPNLVTIDDKYLYSITPRITNTNLRIMNKYLTFDYRFTLMTIQDIFSGSSCNSNPFNIDYLFENTIIQSYKDFSSIVEGEIVSFDFISNAYIILVTEKSIYKIDISNGIDNANIVAEYNYIQEDTKITGVAISHNSVFVSVRLFGNFIIQKFTFDLAYETTHTPNGTIAAFEKTIYSMVNGDLAITSFDKAYIYSNITIDPYHIVNFGATYSSSDIKKVPYNNDVWYIYNYFNFDNIINIMNNGSILDTLALDIDNKTIMKIINNNLWCLLSNGSLVKYKRRVINVL